MAWVEIQASADGSVPRMLLNVANCIAVQEGPNGEAVAVSISGVGVILGERYDAISQDLFGDEKIEAG